MAQDFNGMNMRLCVVLYCRRIAFEHKFFTRRKYYNFAYYKLNY